MMRMRFRIVIFLLVALAFSLAPCANTEAQDTAPKQSDDTSSVESTQADGSKVAIADSATSAKDKNDGKKSASTQSAMSASFGSDGTGANLGTPSISINNPSNSGALNVVIPIEVPPGRNGIAPNLTISYNSNSGNGWLGMGFDLSMGAIQRSTKWGLDYHANGDNAFIVVMGGGASSELVTRNNDWGTNYYGNKIEESFTKYYRNSSDIWVVTTKNGTKFYYGSTLQSRQYDPNDNTHVFKWCLDRVEDTNGNYMTVTYSKDQEEIYLDRIDYTGNGSVNPTNYVKFYRENRTDASPLYATNYPVVTDKRLKTIEVRGNGAMARAYTLTYGTSGTTFRSRLERVQQHGSDASVDSAGVVTGGSVLPAVNIAWQNGELGLNNCATWGSGQLDSDKLADFDGDGRADVYQFINGWSVIRLSTGAGFTEWQNWGSGHLSTDQLADFDGDGKADVYQFINGWSVVRLSTGTGFTEWQNWGSGHLASDILADMDGDGKTDVVQFYNGYAIVRLSTGTGFTEWQTWGSGHLPSDQLADVNGDGKPDVVQFYNGYAIVRLSTGTGFTEWQTWGSGHLPSDRLADVNGDGKADVVQFYNGYAIVRLSTGTGFTEWQTWGYGHLSSDHLVDINGDGKADVYQYINSEAVVRLSTGTGFTEWQNWGSGHLSADRLADVTGDGKVDVVQFYNGTVYVWTNKILSDLPTGITNGIGGTVSISYKPSSEYPNDVLPFIVQTVSSITLNDGFSNLSKADYTYEGGYYSFDEREFRGFAKVKATNPQNNPDISSDRTTLETSYHRGYVNGQEQDVCKKGRPYQAEFKDPAGTQLSLTALTWAGPEPDGACSLSNNSNFVKLAQTSTTKFGVTTIEYYTLYDTSHGGLRQKIISGPSDTESITYDYQYVNKGVWLWRLQSETATGGVSGLVRQTTYGYESGTGNMSWKEFYNNGGTSPKINMSYDNFGNVHTVTDARGNPTTTDYDTATYTYAVKITYPTTYTNGIPITHVIEYLAYDYRYGKPTIFKDENSNQTGYTYDEFGRLKQVDYPGGGQIKKLYFDQDFPRNVLTQIKETTTAFIDKFEYLDGLGRSIQTITFGENDKSIVTRKIYDYLGRVNQALGPYFGTGVGFPIGPSQPGSYPQQNFSYDYFGRPLTITRNDGQYGTVTAASFNYNGLSTTVTDADNISKTDLKDYLGRLRQVTETSGVNTYYTYNAAGDLLTTRDALNNVTTINYDTLGRKWRMIDPDMGTWQYTSYDNNGNLLSQTDARNRTLTFTYDALNRVLTKSYPTPSEPTVYTYDTATNGKGRPASIANENAVITIVSYDSMGRTTAEQKTISGNPTTYTTQYTYDLSGKPLVMTYPDNYQTVNAYHIGSGLLNSITGVSDQRVYAQYSDYEPSGKIGLITYANETTTHYTYDAASMRLTNIRSTAPGNPPGVLHERGYLYTQAGNIQQIDDILRSLTYNYTYDNFHRLQSETVGGTTYNYSYNAIGNILTKPLGAYVLQYSSYDTAHKHAVKTVILNGTTYTYNYDANGNMTSGWDLTDPANVASRTITYNTDNMPTQVVHSRGGQTDFLYDGAGNRVKKTLQNGSITYYIGAHFEVKDGVATKYIGGGAKVTGTNPYYYQKDHLGSSTVMTDQSGAVVETAEYLPFGEMRSHTGSNVTDYKYTGQELDAETGLYYYHARYYDPIIGRFISADTIVQNPADPQTLNRYSYVRNNPIIYVDPSGRGYGWDIVIGAAVGALVSGYQSDWDPKAMVVGAVIGGVSGGVFSGVSGYVSSALTSSVESGAISATTSSAISGAAGGAAAGATAGGMSAAYYGGNVGDAMLKGGLYGGIMGGLSYFGVPDYSPFGDSAAGSIGNRLFNSCLTGAAFGGSYAGITGGNVWQGTLRGAMIWGIGEAANVGIGHTVGFIASGGTGPTFQNGAFVYDADLSGWITFGNVITGPAAELKQPLYTGGIKDPYDRTYFDHEVGHMPQGTILGPVYIPAHVASLTVGGLIGTFTGYGFIDGSHRFGLLERF